MVYGLGINYNGRLGIGRASNTIYPKEVEILCGKNIKTFCCNTERNYENGSLYQTTVFALTEEGQVYKKSII